MPILFAPSLGSFADLSGGVALPDGHPSAVAWGVTVANGLTSARAHLLGALNWSGELWTEGTRAATGNTGVWVGAIDTITLLDGSTAKTFTGSAAFQINTTTHAPSTDPLTVSAVFNVYAYVSGGSLAFQAVTTAPDPANLRWKTGATGTHRFLGAFITDSAGLPVPFSTARGVTLLRRDEDTANTLVLASGTTPATPETFTLTGLVPYAAREILLRIELDASATAEDYLEVYRSVSSLLQTHTVRAAAGGLNSETAWVPVEPFATFGTSFPKFTYVGGNVAAFTMELRGWRLGGSP